MKIASFDIFDTTLIRKCGRPENVFYIMGRYLYPNHSGKQVSYYMWRINAEQKACDLLNKQNPSLSDIYSLYNQECKDDFDKKYLESIEEQIESQQLIYNLQIKNIISEKRAKGYKICFISDMYLSSTFLKKLLIREGCAYEEDDIFVSCECDKRKSTGALYDHVKSYYCHIDEWIHYGDNTNSDVVQCKKKGIKANLVDTFYNQVEKEVESTWKIYPFGRSLSVLVGFQRCSRLHLAEHNVDYDNAADYVASAYIPYLFYIIRQAKVHNIKRLYFLSRDSYVLYKMAATICEKEEIECRYLFISRKALALPLLTELTQVKIEHILGKSIKGKKVDEIVRLFQIDDMLFKFPFKEIKTDKHIEEFINILKKEEKEIYRRQREGKALLTKYFSDAGVFDVIPEMAMVDLGWLGTTRMMVNEIRKEMNLSSIPFFYYGCKRNIFGDSFGEYFAFQPYEFCNRDRTIITESYYSVSKYPSTIGYKLNEERVDPQFGVRNEVNEHLASIHSVVCKTITDYMIETGFGEENVCLSIWGNQYIEQFETHPQYINYSTLKKLEAADKGMVIEHISFVRLLRFLISGLQLGDCMVMNSIYDTYGIVIRGKFPLVKVIKRFLKIFKI